MRVLTWSGFYRQYDPSVRGVLRKQSVSAAPIRVEGKEKV